MARMGRWPETNCPSVHAIGMEQLKMIATSKLISGRRP